MAVNRFRENRKYELETGEYDDATQADIPPSNKRPKVENRKYELETGQYDDDATQADSPPSNKHPKVEEYIANASGSPCSLQDIFTEIQDVPNSQKWKYLQQMDEYDKKDLGNMTDGRPEFNKYKEIGTMTEPGLTCTNNTNIEIRCNEYFGSVVACELANYHGHVRYNKMKAVIDIFKET